MKIALPKRPAYYYECTGLARRLFYYLPPPSLRQLVKDKRAQKTILRDFPDGVEIGVNEEDFQRFKREYGYQPALNADALLAAFALMLAQSKDPEAFRGSGLINAASLEQIALALRPEADPQAAGEPAKRVRRRPRIEGHPKKTTARRELRFDEQSWTRVELTPGANPLQAFEALRKS